MNIKLSFTTFFIVIFSTFLFSDGMAFKGRLDLTKAPQNEQKAVISFEDGIEKLAITIQFDMEDKESGLWIFPVPSKPENIKVDILEQLPNLQGEDLIKEVKNYIFGFLKTSLLTQIYLNPLIFPKLLQARSKSTARVFSHFDKWGISTEVIQCNDVETLHEYIKTKKSCLKIDQLKAFEHYFSKEYSLIVSWINSYEELIKQFPDLKYERKNSTQQKKPSVYLEFKTDQAYYPMLATSYYGDLLLPVHLYVFGLKDIKCNNIYDSYMTKNYYHLYENKNNQSFSNHLIDKRFCTYFHIETKAKNFKSDLFFHDTQNKKIKRIFKFIQLSPTIQTIIFIIMFILMSYISGGLAGLLVFKKWKRYALIGICNCFSIICLMISVLLLKDKIEDDDIQKIIKPEDNHNILSKFLIISFQILFVVINVFLLCISGLLALNSFNFSPLFILFIFFYGYLLKKSFCSYILTFSIIYLILNIIVFIYLSKYFIPAIYLKK